MPFFLLAACAPFPDYWDGEGPTIASASIQGDILSVGGEGLEDASTVVVGGFNALILETGASELSAELPKGLPPGALAVSVVTEDGQSTLESAVTWREAAGDEVASATLTRVDCPIEAWVTTPDAWDLLFWCGVELGYTDAWAMAGPGPQPGFSAELAGYGSLLAAPPMGEWRVYAPGEPRQPRLPQQYGGNAPDETIAIQTPRDFIRDLESLEEQLVLLQSLYYWTIEDVSEPTAWFFDEESCYQDAAQVGEGSTAESLDVSAPAGALGLWLGATLYEEGGYEYELADATAELMGDGSAAPGGVVLGYDDYSGDFLAWAIGGVVGRSDIPDSTEFSVTTTRFGTVVERGTVETPPRHRVLVDLESVPRDLLDESQPVELYRDIDQEIAWEGGQPGDQVVIELSVFDASVDDPGWMTELWRVTGLFPAEQGSVILPADLLAQLPEAPNAVDANYDLVGYWAEVTVTRHHLEALDLDEGQLVVDMAYAVNAPVGLISSP